MYVHTVSDTFERIPVSHTKCKFSLKIDVNLKRIKHSHIGISLYIEAVYMICSMCDV